MLKQKHNKRGFTLVEVSLFLAITGLLFMGIAVGVQNSIYQQRFNDSVQNFAEYLRTVYSGVINVENNIGKGNSSQAIYGKLITFNQEDNKNKIDAYTVVGNISSANEAGSTLENLMSEAISIHTENESGIAENYTPRWMAQIKNTENSLFKGSLLVVRNPKSGTVYTYFSKDLSGNLKDFSPEDIDDINFCISPEGVTDLNASRNVRIVDGARNSSGIEVVSDEDSACRS